MHAGFVCLRVPSVGCVTAKHLWSVSYFFGCHIETCPQGSSQPDPPVLHSRTVPLKSRTSDTRCMLLHTLHSMNSQRHTHVCYYIARVATSRSSRSQPNSRGTAARTVGPKNLASWVTNHLWLNSPSIAPERKACPESQVKATGIRDRGLSVDLVCPPSSVVPQYTRSP